MLRKCYKCYEIVKCRFSGLEIPRLPRYLTCRLGYIRAGELEAASCELVYTRGASWASWPIYAREDELEKFRWLAPKKTIDFFLLM